jgi:hypothetical protein
VFVVVFFGILPAGNALWVGGNIDVHNNTGVTAHDFHVTGTIKSTTTPSLGFAIGYADGGPFPSFNHSITHSVADLWDFDATWSSQDVDPSQEGHFGLFFEVTSRNVFVDLDGWWTDTAGNSIGSWPILGFEVPTNWWDPPEEQVFRLQGDSGEEGIPVEIVQMDLKTVDPGDMDPTALFELLNVDDMDQLDAGSWMPVRLDGQGGLEPDSFFDVFTELVVGPIRPDQLLFSRTLATWPAEPDGRWFFHAHQAHPLPEPASILLLGSAVFGVAIRCAKRRRQAV